MKAIKMKHLWLMAAFVCGFGLTVTSCKDDNELSPEEQEQQLEQDLDQAAEFWNVVGQLTDDILPDEGWQETTYNVSIGRPDGDNDAVRIVSCGDAEEAAQRFADLVGLTPDDGFSVETQEYTYSSEVVGTLRYHKVFGSALAIVDVDIKQMPGLSQIIYKSPDQDEENASFSGTAYYRFGDVVSKKNSDGQTDYWICVRPCFGPASKGDSHWISVSKLPEANVKAVPKTVKGVELTHVMPKGLATNQNQMQNLAELLYAILFPDEWAQNLSSNYSKLKYFVDLKYTKHYKYHNKYFFQQVRDLWGHNIKNLFGLTADEMRQELSKNGLNLIYNSATMSGNNVILPMAQFSGTNLKTKVLVKKSTEWKTSNFNIYDLTKKGYAEFKNYAGGVERAWLVRYATGATLAKGSAENPVFNKYKRLPNCTDIFVYNRDIDNLDMTEATLKATPPKEAKEIDQIAKNAPTNGCGTYLIGDVVKDEYGNRWICIAGSPWTPETSFFEDHDARFISFDFKDVSTSDEPSIRGLPKEDELPNLTNLLTTVFAHLRGMKGDYQVKFGEFAQEGKSLEHIRQYAGVDIYSMVTPMDSVWTFVSNGKTYHSTSTSFTFNIAYDNGIRNRQAIARIISDETHEGSERTKCIAASGNHYDIQKSYCYTCYETFDPSRMGEANADEASLGMNDWSRAWAMTSDKMYLQDVTDQDMINRHAADDKWIKLPLAEEGKAFGTGQKRKPRTQAVAHADPEDCIGRTNTLGMFHEPVWFIRTMKVRDTGGKVPNLVSTDGRKLTIVHLQDDDFQYKGAMQNGWALLYCNHSKYSFFKNNVHTVIPPLAGYPM